MDEFNCFYSVAHNRHNHLYLLLLLLLQLTNVIKHIRIWINDYNGLFFFTSPELWVSNSFDRNYLDLNVFFLVGSNFTIRIFDQIQKRICWMCVYVFFLSNFVFLHVKIIIYSLPWCVWTVSASNTTAIGCCSLSTTRR